MSSSHGGAGEDKNGTSTNGLSWVMQLQQYMRDVQGHEGGAPQQAGSNRKVLCDIVLDNPNSAEAWFNFLDNEELCTKHSSSAPPAAAAIAEHRDGDAATSGKAGGVGLYHLYHKATELVQRSKGRPLDAYVKIWVGYARHQWAHNEDEARDTFKTLKNQHIADSNALLFYAWASLEASSGNTSKALGILGKALKEHAQPASILQGLLAELQDSPAHTKLPQEQQQQQNPKTPHSSHGASHALGSRSYQTASGSKAGNPLQFKTPVAMPTQQHPHHLRAPPSTAHHHHPLTASHSSGYTSHSTTSSHSSGASLHTGGSATAGLRLTGSLLGAGSTSGARAHATALHHLTGSSPPPGELQAQHQQHQQPLQPLLHSSSSGHAEEPVVQTMHHCTTASSANNAPLLHASSSGHAEEPVVQTVHPPPTISSSRTLHSLSSSEDDPLFHKGSDHSATMTSATAGLDGDVSMRSAHFEGTGPTNAAHLHGVNAQGGGSSGGGGGGGGNLTARSEANHTGGLNLNLTGGLTGNHTAQMGIKRFGFKSKALRVTHTGADGGSAAVAAAAGAGAVEPTAGSPSVAAENGVLMVDTPPGVTAGNAAAPAATCISGAAAATDTRAGASTPDAEEVGGGGVGEGARSLLRGALDSSSSGGSDGSASRKRRAGSAGSYSPRNPAAVVEDGTKRRASPPQEPLGHPNAYTFPQLPIPFSATHSTSAVEPPVVPTQPAVGVAPDPQGSWLAAGADSGRAAAAAAAAAASGAVSNPQGPLSAAVNTGKPSSPVLIDLPKPASHPVFHQQQRLSPLGQQQHLSPLGQQQQQQQSQHDQACPPIHLGPPSAAAQPGQTNGISKQQRLHTPSSESNARAATAAQPVQIDSIHKMQHKEQQQQQHVAARENEAPLVALQQQKQQHIPASENEAPAVVLQQPLGVAGWKPHQQQQQQQAALKQHSVMKPGHVLSSATETTKPRESQAVQQQRQQQQHREPLRVVRTPVQQQASQQHPAPVTPVNAVPAAAAAAAAAAAVPAQAQEPQLHPAVQHHVPHQVLHPQVQQQQQQQLQQQQQQQQQPLPQHHHVQQQQQQVVAAVAAAASCAPPDLRAAPPERLPEPQRRALEDANWVYVNGLRYQKLDCVGRGGSSKVFKVLGCNRQIYALKRVRLANKDPEAIRGFIDEITLLKQLRNTPNIIQLISAQVFREECLIYMVLEYGDIDLARLLQNHEEARRRQLAHGSTSGSSNGVAPSVAGGSGEIDENFIRLYWQQMLQAVGGIHELRIVHSDLKPANFLLVQGQLKLIDFGIAKSIQGDTTSINRESQVGTLNYMSPEAIQGGSNNPLGGPPLKVGRPSDVWSLGCILYQMVYGQTPFADIPFIPKMNAICNPSHAIRFAPCANPAAAEAMARCLDRNPRTRITIPELLDHTFLHPERVLAAAPPVGGVSEEQLKSIVSQIAMAGASGTADIDTLTRQVLAQLKSQQPDRMHVAPPAAPAPPSQPHKHAKQPHPIRPPTPARCPIPLSPCEQSPPASPMDAEVPSPLQRQRAAHTPDTGSGASAAAAGIERLHFEDDVCSS